MPTSTGHALHRPLSRSSSTLSSPGVLASTSGFQQHITALRFQLYASSSSTLSSDDLRLQRWEVIQRVPGGRNILITLENADLSQPRIG